MLKRAQLLPGGGGTLVHQLTSDENLLLFIGRRSL